MHGTKCDWLNKSQAENREYIQPLPIFVIEMYFQKGVEVIELTVIIMKLHQNSINRYMLAVAHNSGDEGI